MGVNMAGNCIYDDEVCREASRQEILRRYFASLNRLVNSDCPVDEVYKIEVLMKQAKVSVEDRKVVFISFKKMERMMQPPRHINAIAP